MQVVNEQLVYIALERIQGSDFEEFFNSFYPALAGINFVPLGGLNDGGADAFESECLFVGAGAAKSTIYQATVQVDHRAKIRATVRRLRETERDLGLLQYVTARGVSQIDKEEEHLTAELGVPIRIRDKKWIAANINHSRQTMAAFSNHLEPHLTFLKELGGASTVGRSANLPARTLCVFLGQEVDRRRGNTQLLEAVTDSLILWALEGTDPDEGLFMTRAEISDKIASALPTSQQFVRGVFNHRIKQLAAKGNPTGREIRWYRKSDKFCLPYETRKIATKENIEDETLKQSVMDEYEKRAARALDDIGEGSNLTPNDIAPLAHRTLELTFEREGLELAGFLTNSWREDLRVSVSDHVDSAIDDFHLSGNTAVAAKEITLLVLREAFYDSTESERIYYGKLSRAYALMLTLRNEPRVVEYFRSMSSNFVLFVGSDIIVRALSERYLAPEDQMTVNMLRILKEAGATLILTHMTVEEVHAHLKITDNEFRDVMQELEPYMDKNIIRHSGKILIRAYFYAKFDPLLDRAPQGWAEFIGQICDITQLQRESISRDQIKQYLLAKFGLEFFDRADISKLVNEQEADQLTQAIQSIKSENVLARNDARHILAVYGQRRELKEGHQATPYGYRTWWLTHESRVRQCTRKLVRSHGAEYIIRPDFVLNFVALSPSAAAVRESYGKVFPTLLGVRLSNRLKEEVFRDVMRRAKEARVVDEARAGVIMSDLSNKLKGDNYKKYETEWLTDPFGEPI